jgi:hypothetical protein
VQITLVFDAKGIAHLIKELFGLGLFCCDLSHKTLFWVIKKRFVAYRILF